MKLIKTVSKPTPTFFLPGILKPLTVAPPGAMTSRAFNQHLVRLLCLMFTLSVYSAPSNAQMSAYESKKIEQVLRSPAVEKRPDIFDGTAFNPDIELETGYRYMKEFVTGINKVVREINGMTSPARSSEQGRKFIAEAQEKLAYSKAMKNAFRSFESAKKDKPKPTSTTALKDSPTETVNKTKTDHTVLTAEQSSTVTIYLDELDKLMSSQAFDGTELNSTLSWEDAQSFQQQFLNTANNAANAYNALSTDSKNSEPGKTLLSKVQEHLNNARRVNGALSNHRVLLQRQLAEATNKKQSDAKKRREAEAHEREEQEQLAAQAAAESAADLQAERTRVAPVCAAFSTEVMTRRNRRGMASFLQNPDAVTSDYKAMSRFLKLAKKVAANCAKPDYSALLHTSCSDSAEEDPKAWCEAATTAHETMRNHILRERSNWELIAEERYMSADELDQKNGWVQIEGPTSLEEVLSFERMIYVNTVDFGPDKQRNLFKSLDIEADDFPHYTASLDYIDELREAIEDGAGSWPEAPRAASGEDTNYGTTLAANNIVERWHPNAEIKDSWLSRANWKIIRNSLGVIQRRTLPGHVLFKLPQDQYCQLRSFTLTEQYIGNSKFQPAKGVRFGYVRFEEC
ncbi:MAG: hypothetical protein KTR32_26390 [Granulosicoccus sp.]|nr:hypothetical protein [Granulosicoccus sp.]